MLNRGSSQKNVQAKCAHYRMSIAHLAPLLVEVDRRGAWLPVRAANLNPLASDHSMLVQRWIPNLEQQMSRYPTPPAYTCVRMLERHAKSATFGHFWGRPQAPSGSSRSATCHFYVMRSNLGFARAARRETPWPGHPQIGHNDCP